MVLACVLYGTAPHKKVGAKIARFYAQLSFVALLAT